MEIKRFKNYITWKDNQGNFNTECNRASLPTDISLTIPTNDLTKVCVSERERESKMKYSEESLKRIKDNVVDKNGQAPTLTANAMQSMNHQNCSLVEEELAIRKLTDKEVIRLMGFTDEDYYALKEVGLSKSAIYHVAGDSIITTCLVGLLNPFVNERNKHIEIITDYVENHIVEKGGNNGTK